MDAVDIFIPGPEGLLEAMTTLPIGQKSCGVAIICHPHPLYQGTMHNKVVTTLAKAMDQRGIATIRFNYRGVGKSDGSYGAMQGEIADLAAVKAWANTCFPGQVMWLAGFSFGAFIAASIANVAEDIEGLITVAPAVHHANFSALSTVRCPWLVIQGDQDEIVPYKDVVEWVGRSPLPLHFQTIKNTGHFFHGRLGALQELVVQWITHPN